jgi:hypothetical protein
MNRRVLCGLLLVGGMAVAFSVGSAIMGGNATRAEGPGGARVKVEREPAAVDVPVPVAPASAPVTPPPPAVSAPVPVAPVTAYPAPGITPTDGSLTLSEIFQLRTLKKRIGAENLKRLIDALAD